MARRRTKSKKTDRRIFRQTADKTQAINIKPVTMRGGIRL